MRNLKQPLVAVAMLMLWSFVGYSQSIEVDKLNLCDVDYKVKTVAANTLVFTLLGDGQFSLKPQPKHHFKTGPGSYDTKAFLVKPYDTNPPIVVDTPTVIKKWGGTYPNLRPRMAGDIDILYSWCPATKMENFFILAFTNTSSSKPIDGCIEFHWNDNEMTMNYPGIELYNGWVFNQNNLPSGRIKQNRKIKWDFTNLKQFERRYLYIPAKVLLPAKARLELFATYYAQCKTGQDNPGGGVGGASITKADQVRPYSHDPNGKHVTPACLNPDPVEPVQYLEFDMSFFNDGTGPASFVQVIDQLSPHLDPSTFVFLSSSHYAEPTLSGHTLTVDYPGIYLPGTNQIDWAGGHGDFYTDEACTSYLSFGICTMPIPPHVTCIQNQAEVYFDANPVVYTTIAEACKEQECFDWVSCSGIMPRINEDQSPTLYSDNKLEKVKVWPNPFDQAISLSFESSNLTDAELNIEIVDLRGQVQNSFKFTAVDASTFNESLLLKNLPSGVYFMMIRVDGEQILERIVKY